MEVEGGKGRRLGGIVSGDWRSGQVWKEVTDGIYYLFI